MIWIRAVCTSAKIPVSKGQFKCFLKALSIKWTRRRMRESHQCLLSSISMAAKVMLQQLMCLICPSQVKTVSWKSLRKTSRRWAFQICRRWTKSTWKPMLDVDQDPIPQMKVNKSRWVAKAWVQAAVVTTNLSALKVIIAVKALKTWKKKKALSPESKTFIWFTNLRLSSLNSLRKIDSIELKHKSSKNRKVIKSPTLTNKDENSNMLRRQSNESKALLASAALIWSRD